MPGLEARELSLGAMTGDATSRAAMRSGDQSEQSGRRQRRAKPRRCRRCDVDDKI